MRTYMSTESSTVGTGPFKNGTDKRITRQVREKLGCFSSREKLVNIPEISASVILERRDSRLARRESRLTRRESRIERRDSCLARNETRLVTYL